MMPVYKPLTRLLLTACLYWVAPVWADMMEGKLTRVVDGDTVVVTDAGKKNHLFRLLGADAPEKKQPFYLASKKALKDRYLDKTVSVEWLRTKVCPPKGECAQLARVLVKGEDLALRQITQGLAWHDKSQRPEQSTADRALYADAELVARQRGRGLWKSADPLAPWEFGRAKKKPSHKPRKR